MENKRRKTSDDMQCLLLERKGVLDLMTIKEYADTLALVSHVFEMEFKQHRDNYHDKLSLIDCAIEIIKADASQNTEAIEMCHKIQNSLSNAELRAGWKVSFSINNGSHRFHYLNDIIRERRLIHFRLQPL